MNKLVTLTNDIMASDPPPVESMLALLQHIREMPETGVADSDRAIIGRAMHAFLTAFCDPWFVIPDEYAIGFVQANTLIANCMAMLNTTTDPWILTLDGQEQAGFKTVVLYSARNTLDVDIESLMGQNPGLVSVWLYHAFQVIFSAAPNRDVVSKLCSFVDKVDERIVFGLNMQEAYFGVTYTGNMLAERRLKELINQACRKALKPDIVLDPDPTRIAIWAEYWYPGHSVHRSLRDYVAALKTHFHLTLIHSPSPDDAKKVDTSLFDEVVWLDMEKFDLSPLHDRKFAAAVYCDIGMTMPSIMMANVRLAPIQVMMTGHPVSTFGAEIDYFLSGDLVEDGRVYGNDRFYSEKLLSLPGYGATHTRPTYEIKGRTKQTDAVLINCSWLGQKCHYECLESLERAVANSGQKVHVRLFVGPTPAMHKGLPAFIRDVRKILKTPKVEIIPMIPYEEYMGMMEEADFSVDCFPFGGSNTVSDSIHLGKPVISLQGKRWFSRIGPAMVENFCGYMAPETVEEYESEIARMISEAAVAPAWPEDRNYDAVYRPQGARELAEWMKATVRRN